MQFLIDSNVLCRLARADDPQHAEAKRAVDILLQKGHPLFITPQVEREFWSVATRPREQNGLGLTAAEAKEHLRAFERFASFKPDTAAVHENWRHLVAEHRVLGKNVHDVGHVAAMQAHAVKNVLTFNAADFHRFEKAALIAVSTPQQIIREHAPGPEQSRSLEQTAARDAAADTKASQEARRQQALDALTKLTHEQRKTPDRDPSRDPER